MDVLTAADRSTHDVKWMSPFGVQLRGIPGYWLCRHCGRRWARSAP